MTWAILVGPPDLYPRHYASRDLYAYKGCRAYPSWVTDPAEVATWPTKEEALEAARELYPEALFLIVEEVSW